MNTPKNRKTENLCKDNRLIDENCPNDGDCSTCEKRDSCSNAEAQEALNQALKIFQK